MEWKTVNLYSNGVKTLKKVLLYKYFYFLPLYEYAVLINLCSLIASHSHSEYTEKKEPFFSVNFEPIVVFPILL